MTHARVDDEFAPFVLAFDFGGTKIAIATATRDGEMLQRTDLSTVAYGDGKTALHQAILAGQALVRTTTTQTRGTLVCVGVATMGITLKDRVLMAPNVPGWAELRMEDSFQSAFPGIAIQIDNDVKAAALAELKKGALQDVDVGLFVNLGTGIALAYTLEGKVLQGAHGASGEIAYNLLTKFERAGARDNVAPLEEFAGGRSIGERASLHFGEKMSAGDLFRKAQFDMGAKRWVEETLQEIAFHLTNVMIAWDPGVVAFGGGLMGAGDLILPYLSGYSERFVPFPPQLKMAHFRRDAGLYGAIELALLGWRKHS
ncbi:ROK family protein [Ferroacidibacillus organovorans]|uniref:Glucokinase n=1 Tax=Ferroacidibacillus organovorans TaxID=1765683 RepID=A0A162SY50_9BACL|nr:ROK family protein [Ferroacidibacillus organovorans]KYP80262.1 hypothetical protein AYJ22_11965 [Ferroacidibacillus organovorans]OAG93232.1 hypothetical protein AYW79_11650 [Ferroacidibacillus organovorans]OPG17405.1 hypothetical protein B2M26_01325 [Ferroacidibacillus organovorans]